MQPKNHAGLVSAIAGVVMTLTPSDGTQAQQSRNPLAGIFGAQTRPHCHETAPRIVQCHASHTSDVAGETISYEDFALKEYNNAYRKSMEFTRPRLGGQQQQPAVQPHYHAPADYNYVIRHTHLGGNLAHTEEGLGQSIGEAEFRREAQRVKFSGETFTDDMHCHAIAADPREALCHSHVYADVGHIHMEGDYNVVLGKGVTLDEHFRSAGLNRAAIVQQTTIRQQQPQPQKQPTPTINPCKDISNVAARLICEQALNR